MIMIFDSQSRFTLGFLCCTRGVIAEIDAEDVAKAIAKHRLGDWGLVCEEDRLENEFSLENGLRLLSIYESSEGKRFWIITEYDRSATTVLLPEEY